MKEKVKTKKKGKILKIILGVIVVFIILCIWGSTREEAAFMCVIQDGVDIENNNGKKIIQVRILCNNISDESKAFSDSGYSIIGTNVDTGEELVTKVDTERLEEVIESKSSWVVSFYFEADEDMKTLNVTIKDNHGEEVHSKTFDVYISNMDLADYIYDMSGLMNTSSSLELKDESLGMYENRDGNLMILAVGDQMAFISIQDKNDVSSKIYGLSIGDTIDGLVEKTTFSADDMDLDTMEQGQVTLLNSATKENLTIEFNVKTKEIRTLYWEMGLSQ